MSNDDLFDAPQLYIPETSEETGSAKGGRLSGVQADLAPQQQHRVLQQGLLVQPPILTGV
jgi:hypothetical protein